jgi:uncharacterized SAM-binding protein YcdF (DUF218 family)
MTKGVRRLSLSRRTWILILIVTVAGLVSAGPALVVRRPIEAPDAIISLASHEWERLPVAARLAAAAPGALILLTRPEHVTPYNCHDCDHRVERLQILGVDPARVKTVQVLAPGTHGEALAALAFAREHGTRRMVIATSPYHTRRALAVFRTVFEGTGVEIGVEPAAGSSPAEAVFWWVKPVDFAYVPYEWAAIGYYAWAHGVWPMI